MEKQDPDGTRCPSCKSPEPRLHPATQAEGEVLYVCPDPFRDPAPGEPTDGGCE